LIVKLEISCQLDRTCCLLFCFFPCLSIPLINFILRQPHKKYFTLQEELKQCCNVFLFKYNFSMFQENNSSPKKYPLLKPNFTELDKLTELALEESEIVENKIYDFLSERSIIERTDDCKLYFEKYITVNALVNKSITVS